MTGRAVSRRAVSHHAVSRRVVSRRRAAAIAIAVGILMAPTLTACANPIGSIVEGVTGGNVDLGGTSVPEDFPDAVPLYDGEIVQGLAIGKGAERAWTVIVKVPDATAIDDIKAQLEGAGLSAKFDQSAGEVAGATFSSDTLGVIVGITEDGSGGYVATYVVTPTGA